MLLPSGSGIGDSNPILAVSVLSSPCNLLTTPRCSPHHVVQRQWLRHPIRLRYSKHYHSTKHFSACFGGPRAGLEQIAHNQVLVSATAACLIGQLSKPLASALLGKGFNWGLVLKSGGMPSTHSASIVASATAIGLERGFSDSLFGLSVVVAGIVMYDAQGDFSKGVLSKGVLRKGDFNKRVQIATGYNHIFCYSNTSNFVQQRGCYFHFSSHYLHFEQGVFEQGHFEQGGFKQGRIQHGRFQQEGSDCYIVQPYLLL